MSYVNEFRNLGLNPSDVADLSVGDEPSALDQVVSLFTATGVSESTASVHARSIRVPSFLNLTIEAMAKHSGLSVNKVIVQLLELASQEVLWAMPEEHRNAVFDIRSEMMSGLVKDETGIPRLGGEPSRPGEL